VARELAFLDTNVLVYAIDLNEPAKRARALELLGAESGPDLICGTQVLGELFNALTRKLRMPAKEAAAEVRNYMPLSRVAVDSDLVERAMRLYAERSISYWDALIVAAAARSGATTLFTEDLNDGEEMLGVRIVNPFAGL